MGQSATIEQETFQVEIAPPTPMMEQYLAIKKEHKDYLLFYRMGDFYELFLEDALIAAEVLDITLTHRGQHMGKPLPMCGVPYHSYESYLHKLIKNEYKVAICEQMEKPEEAKKRGAKSVVRREVTRIITPGTITEDTLLDSNTSNYLAAINIKKDKLSLAWVDISTGEFKISEIDKNALSSELARINPQELLIPDTLWSNPEFKNIVDDWKKQLTPYTANFFESKKGQKKIKDFYQVSSLDSFGKFNDCEFGCLGALIEYIELTQKGSNPRLDIPKRFTVQNFMHIDNSARKNLEMTHTLAGQHKGSLLNIIDNTVSSSGSRQLYNFLNAPLMDVNAIAKRQDIVEYFINNKEIRNKLRHILTSVPDMERALSRICIGRGGPRDLVAIREALQKSMQLTELLEFSKTKLPGGLKTLLLELGNHDLLAEYLKKSLKDEVGVLARDGNFIKEGFNPKLDEYHSMHQNAKEHKDQLKEKYSKDTGINGLRIKENNVIGLFIEINPQYQNLVPEFFVHRQTLGSCVRYTSPELKELETKIINAKGYALDLELQLFDEIINSVIKQADSISVAAQAIAKLDVFSSFAESAVVKNYCRPVVDNSDKFNVIEGRHPVVEEKSNQQFIPNNCNLSDNHKMWLITGPNMAGKSTFLRQNALIAILAQIGSYVPAGQANIGIIDKIFSRVGAADDLASGQSTFMVEMVETAAILHHATEKSLVILDEIGRGTATFDGLSIAWAVLEYIHEHSKCRTLFATHYHEITHLSEQLENLVCYTVKVREWKNDIIFLHQIIPGSADRSYGIHVGKIAGLPKNVISRAEEVLNLLQEGESGSAINRLISDLPLFNYDVNKEVIIDEPVIINELEEKIKSLDIDNLSPREALAVLYDLKSQIIKNAI